MVQILVQKLNTLNKFEKIYMLMILYMIDICFSH